MENDQKIGSMLNDKVVLINVTGTIQCKDPVGAQQKGEATQVWGIEDGNIGPTGRDRLR